MVFSSAPIQDRISTPPLRSPPPQEHRKRSLSHVPGSAAVPGDDRAAYRCGTFRDASPPALSPVVPGTGSGHDARPSRPEAFGPAQQSRCTPIFSRSHATRNTTPPSARPTRTGTPPTVSPPNPSPSPPARAPPDPSGPPSTSPPDPRPRPTLSPPDPRRHPTLGPPDPRRRPPSTSPTRPRDALDPRPGGGAYAIGPGSSAARPASSPRSAQQGRPCNASGAWRAGSALPYELVTPGRPYVRPSGRARTSREPPREIPSSGAARPEVNGVP